MTETMTDETIFTGVPFAYMDGTKSDPDLLKVSTRIISDDRQPTVLIQVGTIRDEEDTPELLFAGELLASANEIDLSAADAVRLARYLLAFATPLSANTPVTEARAIIDERVEEYRQQLIDQAVGS